MRGRVGHDAGTAVLGAAGTTRRMALGGFWLCAARWPSTERVTPSVGRRRVHAATASLSCRRSTARPRRPRCLTGRLTSVSEPEAHIAAALLRLGARAASETTSPYLAHYLAEHVGAARALPRLAEQTAVLAALDPESVKAEALRTGFGQLRLPAAITVAMVAGGDLAVDPDERRLVRDLAAHRLRLAVPGAADPALRWCRLRRVTPHVSLTTPTGWWRWRRCRCPTGARDWPAAAAIGRCGCGTRPPAPRSATRSPATPTGGGGGGAPSRRTAPARHRQEDGRCGCGTWPPDPGRRPADRPHRRGGGGGARPARRRPCWPPAAGTATVRLWDLATGDPGRRPADRPYRPGGGGGAHRARRATRSPPAARTGRCGCGTRPPAPRSATR